MTQQTADPLGKWLWRAGFESQSWSGSLKKYPLGTSSNGTVTIGAALWDAADQWPAASGDSATERKIWTLDRTTGNTTEFRWENLSPQQQQGLHQAPGGGRSDGPGERRINYLRGQRDAERVNGRGVFRSRTSLLGGILNSTPLLVRQSGGSGREVLYVAANDGMLHAFSAADGIELFGYVPGFLLPELGQSSNPAGAPRNWFDGKLAMQEVRLNGARKTVLVAAAGVGSKGVVALDVSRPDQFGSGTGALWEFSDADDPAMGVVIGMPAIATFRVRLGERRSFAVVSTEPGGLFLLALDKPAGARWQRGVNYFKLATSAEGLSAAALVPDENGTVRFAFAGDLAGKLWRFDFTGVLPWPSPKLVFSASDSGGKSQPIVAKPGVVFAPGGGYLVLFGTGRLLTPEEGLAIHHAPQSLYAVHDTTVPGQPVISRAALVARTVRKSGRDSTIIDGAAFTYGSETSDRKGWYLDFPEASRTGERQVETALANNGLLIFRSLIPANDGCDRGDGRTYFLDPLTGLSPAGSTVMRTSTGGPVAPVVLSSFDRSASSAAGGAVLLRRITLLTPGVSPSVSPGLGGQAAASSSSAPAPA
ncbi:PilC/PilY family type IV pilus protein, partial [Actimicrobium sp. CCC2.4]